MEPSKLLDLYRIAVDEYRFEVRLNSDRSIQLLAFNAALFSAGVGLFKLGGPAVLNLFVVVVFAVGAVNCLVAVRVINQGHKYYHRTVHKKTLIESELGLLRRQSGYAGDATFAIATTAGQGDRFRILHDPAWPGEPGKQRKALGFVRGMCLVFWTMFAGNLVGGIAAAWTGISGLLGSGLHL